MLDIVRPEDVAEKLYHYYLHPESRFEDGDMIFTSMKVNYNSSQIMKRWLKQVDQLLK